MDWKKVAGKIGKHALITGLAAAAPPVVQAITQAQALSQVNWVGLGDRAGAIFVSAALGGLAGGAANAWKHWNTPTG